MSRYGHATVRDVRRALIIAEADCNDLSLLDVLADHKAAL